MTEVGANVAVTSEGTPEMLKFTTPVKPFTAPIVTVSVPLELRFTVIDGGATETVKSAAATMKADEKVIDQTYSTELSGMSFDGQFDPQALEIIRHSLKDLEILDFVPETAKLYTSNFVPVKVN